ncbi:MAG: hypothetical protein ACRC2R_04510 [Xenococcaceae cyanobacterium]
MIGEDRQPGTQYDREYRAINPEQSYPRSVDSTTTTKTTNIEQQPVSIKGASGNIPKDAFGNPIAGASGNPIASASGNTPKDAFGNPIAGASDNKPAGKGINPALAGALMGGLIGASLGALNGAFNGKKASQGFNHTVKGVGSGIKNVGEGLSYTAKGLGQVVTSLGQGISYSVVGGAQDAIEGIGEATKQAADTVKDTAQNINSAVANTVQDTAQNINSAVANTADMAKGATDMATSSVANVANTAASSTDVAQYSQPIENPRVDELADRTEYNASSTAMSDEEGMVAAPDDRVIVRSNF